jgi:hypothetical protein
MKVVVSRTLTTNDPAVLLDFISKGFDVQRAGVRKAKPDGKAVKPKRRRRRAPRKVEPALVEQMRAERKEGKLYRVIGKRYGYTAARAWQLINKGC